MLEMERSALEPQLVLERCAGFYPAMKIQGMASGLSASLFDLTTSIGEKSRAQALERASDKAASAARMNSYERAYTENFRATNTRVNMIDSPNPLFFSDRAICREALL